MHLLISELPDLYGDFGSGPGTPFPGSGDMLDVPDYWSTIDARPGGALAGVRRHI